MSYTKLVAQIVRNLIQWFTGNNILCASEIFCGFCKMCSVGGQRYFADMQTKCVIFGVLSYITVSAYFVRANTRIL